MSIPSDPTVFYYSYSTMAQTLAGAFGFLAAIVLFRLQTLTDQLRHFAEHILGDQSVKLEPYHTFYIHHQWADFLRHLQRDADPAANRPEFRHVNFLELGAMDHTVTQVALIRRWFYTSMILTVLCITTCLLALAAIPWFASPPELITLLTFALLCFASYGRLVYVALAP